MLDPGGGTIERGRFPSFGVFGAGLAFVFAGTGTGAAFFAAAFAGAFWAGFFATGFLFVVFIPPPITQRRARFPRPRARGRP